MKGGRLVRLRKLLLCVTAAAALAPVAMARTLSDLAVYPSTAAYGPPGIYLPSGPDAIVTARLACPDSHQPILEIVLPAGADQARYVVPETSAPDYQPMAESLTQDYAHAPRRILYRLHYGPVAVDGYLRFGRPWSRVRFRAPGCILPWTLTVRARRIPDTYVRGSMPRYGASLIPFPDEPRGGGGY